MSELFLLSSQWLKIQWFTYKLFRKNYFDEVAHDLRKGINSRLFFPQLVNCHSKTKWNFQELTVRRWLRPTPSWIRQTSSMGRLSMSVVSQVSNSARINTGSWFNVWRTWHGLWIRWTAFVSGKINKCSHICRDSICHTVLMTNSFVWNFRANFDLNCYGCHDG